MSDRVRALVWDFYDPKRFGAPLVMAIALSDEADDRGNGIHQSVPELARKTRQTDRAVQKQLRAMEDAALLVCVVRGKGGQGGLSEYRLDLSLLVGTPDSAQKIGKIEPVGGELRSPLKVNDVHPSPHPKVNDVHPSATDHIYAFKELFVEHALPFTVQNLQEDRRLADWIFARLKILVPTARDPNWKKWCRELRLLRERDKRTRREIAELFAWANADPFWQANVLCPSTLRRQWERLSLQRSKSLGALPAQKGPLRRSCAHTGGCTRDGAREIRGQLYCHEHADEIEVVA